jgi:hypothetical protein
MSSSTFGVGCAGPCIYCRNPVGIRQSLDKCWDTTYIDLQDQQSSMAMLRGGSVPASDISASLYQRFILAYRNLRPRVIQFVAFHQFEYQSSISPRYSLRYHRSSSEGSFRMPHLLLLPCRTAGAYAARSECSLLAGAMVPVRE